MTRRPGGGPRAGDRLRRRRPPGNPGSPAAPGRASTDAGRGRRRMLNPWRSGPSSPTTSFFHGPAAAARCALALRAHLARWREGQPGLALGARCGLAHGELLASDGDFFGLVQCEAARVCGEARPVEVVVSEAVAPRSTTPGPASSCSAAASCVACPGRRRSTASSGRRSTRHRVAGSDRTRSRTPPGPAQPVIPTTPPDRPSSSYLYGRDHGPGSRHRPQRHHQLR